MVRDVFSCFFPEYCVIVKCLRYVFFRYRSTTTVHAKDTINSEHAHTQQTTPPTPTTTAITPTASGGELQTDNPFSLTDEEIDEMLEVLQQGSVPQRATVDSTLDEDLREVLEMDVDSFLM